MALDGAWDRLIGNWTGSNAFRMMPDDEYATSAATVHIDRGPGEGALLIRYTWAHEGAEHQGLLLITVTDVHDAQAVWLDSFHQHPQPMILTGQLHDGGRVSVAGTYADVWGWQISADPTDGDPMIVMDNVPPGVEPYPVVRLIADPR